MKPTAALRALFLGSTLLAAPSLHAAQIYWDQNGATSGLLDGAGAWLNASQWWNGSSNVNWTSGDDAVFGIGGAGGAVTLASPTTVGSLTFNYFTGTYTLGTAGQTITLNSGITKKAGSGAVSLIGPITLGAAQTWQNNSATALSLSSGGLDNGGFLLTVGGSGNTTFTGVAGNIISGSGGITKNGTGTLELGGAGAPQAHTYSGTTTINGGVVRINGPTYNNSTGTGNLTINDGVLEGYFGGSFTRALGSGAGQIQILGGTSGFGGQGGTSTTFNIGGAAATLVWGSSFFNPDTFVLQAATANTNGKMSLSNGINLSGTDRIISSLQTTDGAAGSGATIAGIISNSTGTAGFTKTGPGNLILTAANTYNGATSIEGGSITLSGASGAIASSSALNLSGGTLRLVNASTQATLNRAGDSAAITSNGGTISYENTSTNAISYAETIGALDLVKGQTNIVLLNDQVGTGASQQTLTIGGVTRTGSTNTSAITFSSPGTRLTKNMIVVTGATSTAANEIIGPWATIGATTAAQTDYAVFSGSMVTVANIAASAQSTWSTSTSSTSNYTMANTLGATTLSATRNINSLRNTSVAQNVTVTIATDVVSLAGHTFNNGDVFTFGGTAPTGATNGNVYYVRDVVAGVSFKVAASSGGAAIDFTGAGTPNVTGGITLSSGNNLGTTGILQAMASGLAIGGSGTGVLTLPTTTADNLYLTVGSTAAMTIGVPIADNTASGILTLVKNGSGTLRLESTNNSYTGDTAINAGILQVGSGAGTNGRLNSGSYAGNIFIGAGAALTFAGDATNNLSGIISGGGALNLNRGTTNLSGANTYTGKTSINLSATNATGSTIGITSFNSVFTDVGLGTTHSTSSSLGAPTTVADGTINWGGTVQVNSQINFTGASETTDRIINFNFNSTGQRIIDNSGPSGSLLKFTSAFTGNGSSTVGVITLQGTRNGELVQGLPLAFATLNKSGAGTWTLGGQAGATTITVSGGTLNLNGNQNNTTTNVSAGTLNLSAIVTGSAINVSGSGTLNQSSTGSIVGAAAIVHTSTGNTVLAGTNTYTGLTHFNGAVNPITDNVIFQGMQALSPNTTLTSTHGGGSGGMGTWKLLDDSATPASRSTVNLTHNQTNASQNTIGVFVGNNSVANGGTSASTQTNSTIQLGNINLNQGAVGAIGGAGVVLSGANGYKLQVANVNVTLQAAYASNWNALLQADATMLVTGNVQQAAGSGGTTTLQLGGSASGSTVSGNVLNSADGTPKVLSLTKLGTGTWALDGTANSFTGAITFTPTTTSAGTLAYASAAGTNAITFNTTTGTATLKYTGASALTMSGAITASALTTGTITLDASGVTSADAINYSNTGSLGSAGSGIKNLILSGNNTGNNTFAGVWANNTGAAATLTKNDSGTWILTNANLYTGATTISAGILQIGNGGTTGSLATTSTINNNATLAFNRSDTVTQGTHFANTIGGGGGVTQAGSGTLVLGGTNTYAGATNVTAGTLIIDGSTSSTSLVTVNSGTTLGGSGTVGGATTIFGTHSPGNSPGIQTFSSDLTYDGGASVVNWELTGNTSTNLANPNAIFDQIIVGGDLDFADLTTLNLSFIAGGSAVLWGDTFWDTNQSWTLYDVTGTTTNIGNLSLTSINWLDSGSNLFNTARPGNSFTLSQSGSDVMLNYVVPVPEPRAALLGGLGMLMLLRRRRD